MKTLLTIFTVFMLTGSVLIAKTYEKDKDGNVVQVFTAEDTEQKIQELTNLIAKDNREISYYQTKIAEVEARKAIHQAELDSINQAKQ